MSRGLLPRPWDSEFFGFPVVEIADPEASDEKLGALLGECRRGGQRLVYWAAREGRCASPQLLDEFAGSLVDRKLTFRRELGAADGELISRPSLPWSIDAEPVGEASAALLALAVTAGEHSRFRLDQRIPEERFVELYRTWMRRSVRHELADVVLVARRESECAGMVTVSEREGCGQIGLIAVTAGERGQGLGRALLAATHAWLSARRASSVSVVTQAANREAVRLYQRAGYALAATSWYHHFWPIDR